LTGIVSKVSDFSKQGRDRVIGILNYYLAIMILVMSVNECLLLSISSNIHKRWIDCIEFVSSKAHEYEIVIQIGPNELSHRYWRESFLNYLDHLELSCAHYKGA
jgi:hypothetical protein